MTARRGMRPGRPPLQASAFQRPCPAKASELQLYWIGEVINALALTPQELRLIIAQRLRRSAGPDLTTWLATELSFGEAAKLYRHLLRLSARRAIVARLSRNAQT